jgi:hypothetical protein
MMRLLRKDLRRLRWLLGLWILILVTRVTLVGEGASIGPDPFRSATAFREMAGMLAMLETLMMALLIARLVHDEPLVGMNAFWLTRPYHRAALFSEKLTFVLVALVLLPSAADVASMLWFHTGAAAQLAAASNYVPSHLTSALTFFVIAVLTASLGSFVLTIVGAVAMVIALGGVIISLSVLTAREPDQYGTLVIDSNPTAGLVLSAAFVIATSAVIVYQYRNRRRPIAIVLAVAALIVPMFVAAWWPWRLTPPPPTLGAWADRAVVRIDQQDPVELGRIGSDASGTRLVVAHVPIAGMPRDYFVRLAGVRSRLIMPDGTVIRTERTGSARRGSHRGITGADMPVSTLLDASVLNAPTSLYDAGSETWPPLVALSESQYAKYRGQTGRLEARLEFQVMRGIRRAVALRPAAGFDDGTSRFEIVGTARQVDGYSVEIRRWRAQSLVDPAFTPDDTFVLFNRARKSALTQRGEQRTGGIGIGVRAGGALTAALPYVFSRAGMGLDLAGSGTFSVNQTIALFPMDGSSPDAVDADWFSGAELMVLEARYAGVLTRSVSVDAFTIPAAPTN